MKCIESLRKIPTAKHLKVSYTNTNNVLLLQPAIRQHLQGKRKKFVKYKKSKEVVMKFIGDEFMVWCRNNFLSFVLFSEGVIES